MAELSLNAATIEFLLEKGLTGDDLLEVARRSEVRSDPTAAQRMARYREKKAAENGATRNVTRSRVKSAPKDNTQTPVLTPVEANASTTPRGRDRGSKIPEDWTPPPIAELSTEARKLAEQWPASSYRAEAEAFRNFWLAETRVTSRKSNWNRAWCNRIVDVHGKVMRQAKFAPESPRPVNDRPMTPEELRRAIQFNEDQGNHEKAKAYRFQLQAREALSTNSRH